MGEQSMEEKISGHEKISGARRFAVPGLAVLAAGLVARSGPARAAGRLEEQLTASSTIAEVKRRGRLRIGISTFVPWAMRDKAGKLIGYEVDVANLAAADLGVKLELVQTAWDGIIPALLSGKFDAIISGMSITPQRNLTVNFSRPYEHSGSQIVANRKLAAGVKTLADFNHAGMVLTCRRGVLGCSYLAKHVPDAKLLQFDTDNEALQEVLNGRAAGWIASEPAPSFAALQHAKTLFVPLKQEVLRSDEAVAIRKGDADSLNWFDNWITYRSTDGSLAARYHYWFKTRDWAAQVGQK